MFRIDLLTGSACLTVTDLHIPGAIPFSFAHTYQSLSQRHGDLGLGWHHPYELIARIERNQLRVLLADEAPLSFELNGLNEVKAPNGSTLNWTSNVECRLWHAAHELNYSFRLVGSKARWTGIEDRFGNQTILEVDDFDHIVSLTDVERRTFRWEYERGLLRSIRFERHAGRPIGETVFTCEYNSVDQLIQTVDRFGGQEKYAYSGDLLVEYTNKLGGVCRVQYDGERRCVNLSHSDGRRRRQFYFDQNRHVTRIVNSFGQTTLHKFNDQGVRTEIVDVEGNTVQFLRDDAGGYLGELLADGSPGPTFHESETGDKWTRVEASGASTTLRRDSTGRPTAIVDAAGKTWEFHRDRHGQVDQYRTPQGYTTLVKHDERGRISRVVYDEANWANVQYAEDGTKERVDFSDGSWNESTYDHYHRIIAFRSKVTADLAIEYDGLNESIHEARGITTYRNFDATGNLSAVTDANGHRWIYRFDEFGRFTKIIDPLGHESSCQYDLEGRIANASNPLGRTFRNDYDALGRIVRQSHFDGSVREFRYDVVGRLTAFQSAAETVDVTCNPVGLIELLKSSADFPVSRGYDPFGRIVESVDGEISLAREFDGDGRCVKDVQDGNAVSIQYDRWDRVTRIATASHQAKFTYDHRGRLVGFATDSGFSADSQYRDEGRIATMRYSGGVSVERRFDARGQLIGQQVTDRVGRVIISEEFTYDAIGNLRSKQRANAEPIRLQHNARNELTRVERGAVVVDEFDYDGSGNRKSNSSGPCRFEPGNRLVESPRAKFEFDSLGRPTKTVASDGTLTFSYDLLGRLTGVEANASSSIQYHYDALFRRIKSVQNDATETTTWAKDVPWEIRLANGSHVRHVFHPTSDRPVAFGLDGVWYVVVTDHRGEATDLVRDSDGAVVWTSCPLGFSSEVNASSEDLNQAMKLRGLGQIQDHDTGLIYQRARYYLPSEGRFLTPDPLGPYAGFNEYLFCMNQPFRLIDPTGLACAQASKEECQKLASSIEGKRKELAERWDEGANPKKILPWDKAPPVWSDYANKVRGVYSAAHVAADGTPIAAGEASSGSVVSHIDQYEDVQRGMNADLQKYYCKGCPKHADKAESNAINNAADWSSKKMHYPSYPPAPPDIASRITQ